MKNMMPFEERWGLKAVEIVTWGSWENRGEPEPGNFLAPNQQELREGTIAWKIACELQAAHDAGVRRGLEGGKL